MKLTRKQELALIELGLKSVIDSLGKRSNSTPSTLIQSGKGNHPNSHKPWTAEQRAKFSATMKAKWAERKKKTKQARLTQ